MCHKFCPHSPFKNGAMAGTSEISKLPTIFHLYRLLGIVPLRKQIRISILGSILSCFLFTFLFILSLYVFLQITSTLLSSSNNTYVEKYFNFIFFICGFLISQFSAIITISNVLFFNNNIAEHLRALLIVNKKYHLNLPSTKISIFQNLQLK